MAFGVFHRKNHLGGRVSQVQPFWEQVAPNMKASKAVG